MCNWSGLREILELNLNHVLVLTLVLVLVWAVDLLNPGSVPQIYNRDSELNQYLLKTCPLLDHRYAPPLWGRSGHVQTWVYALIGRFRVPSPRGRVFLLELNDGSLASFKLFRPNSAAHTADLLVALCPGFCNHSEQKYVRSFVDLSLKHGLCCAVLNHLGTAPGLPLTTPRVFSYGSTEAFGSMVQTLKSWFPQTRLVLLGFSLGANIVVKYLGEEPSHLDRVLCAASVCQGYSATRSHDALMSWTQGRRLYNYILTRSFRRLLLQHRWTLFGPDQDLGPLYRASSLRDIDQFCLRFWGYDSLKDYYKTESCEHYLQNKVLLAVFEGHGPQISVPLLLVNSADDPLVPPSLLQVPRDAADHSPLVTFLLSSHGGHVGFFEGLVLPQSGSWIDKVLVQYISAIDKRQVEGL